MRRYILVKEYNPTYDYWLRGYLKKKKIMGDRDHSWKEAQDIITDMHARGIQDEFFQGYFWSWRNHPDFPPSNFSLLSMIMPVYKNERIDLDFIAQLDKEAKERQQKVIFTIDDAAEVFNSFYDVFIKKPLSLELEKGAEGRALTRYFEGEELDQLLKLKVEEARHGIAVKLLDWLNKITTHKILDDITLTLDQHYEKGITESSPQHSYLHGSEYVKLSIHRTREVGPASAFLAPARGHRVLKEGYEGVYFPSYYVEVQS